VVGWNHALIPEGLQVVITQKELDELFPSPSVREVAFEVRFAPRLRIAPEVWRIQDSLAESYPAVSQEMLAQPDSRVLQAYVFANPETRRSIKVSQENFVVIFNQCSSFEDFKHEALARTTAFAKEFSVQNFQRIGLRYVNHIELKPGQGIQDLRRYVNLPVDMERFDPASIEQLLTEFRLSSGEHKITVRGALLQMPGRDSGLFILDFDCYAFAGDLRSLPKMLDEFHHKIQLQFLEHIREEYKQVMRGKS
jgi:uncharacterized protein (TIGR04255 family)